MSRITPSEACKCRQPSRSFSPWPSPTRCSPRAAERPSASAPSHSPSSPAACRCSSGSASGSRSFPGSAGTTGRRPNRARRSSCPARLERRASDTPLTLAPSNGLPAARPARTHVGTARLAAAGRPSASGPRHQPTREHRRRRPLGLHLRPHPRRRRRLLLSSHQRPFRRRRRGSHPYRRCRPCPRCPRSRRRLRSPEPGRRGAAYASAIASISTLAPDGRAETSIVARAGGWSPTCFA